jgi:hypothetical protein
MKGKIVSILLLTLMLALTPLTVRGEGAPAGLTGGPLENSDASFLGEGIDEYAGYEVAMAGDVNGDGYADLLIGAPEAGSNGAAYLVLGGPGGWRLDKGLGSAGIIKYTGELSDDDAGVSVAGAGDVNNDGYDDMLIGAYAYGTVRPGYAYLVLGSASPSSGGLSSAIKYTGEAGGDGAGVSVAGAGDANGDGYDDLLIGAYTYTDEVYYGAAYLVLGSATPTSGNLSSAIRYTGEAADDRAGESVAGAGDVNGDGYADLLVGAKGYSSNTGRAYLVLGSATPSSGSLSSAIKYTGQGASNYAGRSVAGAGDVNGDGYADLLIGADGYNSNAGRAYLVLGNSSPSSIGLGSADAKYDGENTNDYAGENVAGAGDVNSDGYADLLVGAKGYNTRTGRAYLLLGSANPSCSTNLGNCADAKYDGESTDDYAGESMAGGDVNGDGYSDLLISADRFSTNSGKTYLLFSDYNSATAARYRAMQKTTMAPVEVGFSDVTVDYTSGAETGSVYVTRHYRNTCSTNLASNGLVWTVDSMRGSSAQATFTFKYNNTQIAGWTESNLKLWYRERPCQDWTEDTGATLDTTHNRITGSAVTDPHREYTIAPTQPSTTAVRIRDFGLQLAQEPPWMVAGLGVLVILAAVAEWWRQRLYRREAP